MQYFDNNLRFYRLVRGLSQAELAARADASFTQSYISQLEYGRRPADSTHIGLLAQALGLSIDQLLKRPRPIEDVDPVLLPWP